LYDLPGGARVYPVDVRRGDTSIGQLVVAGRLEPNQLFDTYVGTLLDDLVPVEVVPASQTDGGKTQLVVVNTSLGQWDSIADAAVIAARLPDGDVGRWVWLHDGLIWDVRGPLITEKYVHDLVVEQRAGSDPFNFQGLQGDLVHRYPTIPGVTYYDLPRPAALASMPTSVTWPCAKAYYAAYVPSADDPDPQVADERSLYITVSSIAGSCEKEGFFEQYQAGLDANPALVRDMIAGRPVHRGDNDVLYTDGNVVIHLSSPDPTVMTAHAQIIEAFIAAQPT
jgi:hypothetical protein